MMPSKEWFMKLCHNMGTSQLRHLMFATNARNIIKRLSVPLLNILRITPTEIGSISLRFKRNSRESIGINCSKTTMSYFIETNGNSPEFHSDIQYTSENVNRLIRRIEKW